MNLYSSLFATIILLGFLSSNYVFAEEAVASDEGKEVVNMENIKSEDLTMANGLVEIVNKMEAHSERMINYFLIVLGLVVMIFGFVGWVSIKNWVNNFAQKEFKKIAEDEARKVAREVAREIGESETLPYIERTIAYLNLREESEFAFYRTRDVKEALKKYQAIVRVIEDSLKRFPKSKREDGHDGKRIAWVCGRLGTLNGIEDNHQEALEYFEKALKNNPKNIKHLSNKGFALLRTNNIKEAIAILTKSINEAKNKDNENHVQYINRCAAYARDNFIKNKKEIINDFQKACELNHKETMEEIKNDNYSDFEEVKKTKEYQEELDHKL